MVETYLPQVIKVIFLSMTLALLLCITIPILLYVFFS
jgi:hypothetical protein